MESAARRRLGDIFVERELITEDQLHEALEHQRATGVKLGEALVELGFITRVSLAGVISEQWDSYRVSQPAQGSVVEAALRERLEALTAELAERDRRIAEHEATIAALRQMR